jgi:outer membrane protein TolC
MKKSKLFFVLVVFTLAYKSASAQQTIISDISEDYISRLVSRAEANYPQVKSNQNKINIAQGNIGKARVSYLDAFTFSYIYQPQGINTLSGASGTGAGNNYSYFNGIQAGLFFNLGSFLEKPYAVKEAKQELEIANNDQNQYFLTITNEVKKRYYTYLQDIAFLKLTTQACIDAESIGNDMKHKFQKGEETFDNYTKAQATVTTDYEAKIQAETNLLIAKASIEELLGDKLENIK